MNALKSACVFLLVCAAALASRQAAGQDISGTYTGTYSGGDSGALTIVITGNGAVTCDFYSSSTHAHKILSGSVSAASNYSISCLLNQLVSETAFDSWEAVGNNAGSGAATIQGTWLHSSPSDNANGSFSVALSSSAGGTGAALDVSGLWYDPLYSGSGFNFVVSSVGLITTYYGWDSNNNRLWLTGDIGPRQITAGNAFTINMYETVGGAFLSPAKSSTNIRWGTLTLNFSSCRSASATLMGNDGIVVLRLGVLVGVASAPGC